jgi:transposase-like protein
MFCEGNLVREHIGGGWKCSVEQSRHCFQEFRHDTTPPTHAGRPGKRQDGLTTTERQELTRLRRENRQLKLEREILSKAAAWFARETGTVPDKGSSS